MVVTLTRQAGDPIRLRVFSPRKVRVLAEAFRVLRLGGRLAVVDLVLEHDRFSCKEAAAILVLS